MIRKMIFATVLVAILSSCSKEEPVENILSSGGKNVVLSVKQEAFTRGITDRKGTAEYAVLGSGKIYFLDGANTSIFQRRLTAGEVSILANSKTTASSGNTVTITGVPSVSQYMYFMGNIKTDAGQAFPAVEGSTSADARLRLDRLQGNAENVPMSGLSPAFTLVSGNTYNASVELVPIVARVEIGQVTCQDKTVGNPVNTDITGYKLSGVYLNNVNEYVRLDATPYLNAPVNIANQSGWNSDWASYFTSNVNFPYYAGGSIAPPTGWTANAYVDYCTPQSSGLIFYPDETNGATTTIPTTTPHKSWAYQVCPSAALPSGQTTPAADIPHIILKLTDVTYQNNQEGATTLYVVVTKYKDAATNANILEFKRGNVYRIDNLVFTQAQAVNKPYDGNITVTCTVTVKPWTINSIAPVW